MRRGGRAHGTAEPSGQVAAGITDAAIRKATGKGWGDWYALLDAAGARTMSHQQIRAVIAQTESSSWWQQMIAVSYEQARSLRERHQGEDGFAAHSSKLIKAGVTRVFAAWTDDTLRAGWLETEGWHLRKATPCKSIRATWTDGRTQLDVALWPRGVGVTFIQVEHARLETMEDVHRMKEFWSHALERLREMLEPAGHPQSLAA